MKEKEIVEDMYKVFLNEPKIIKDEFKNTPREQLVSYHSSLGRKIRNRYKLWQNSWETELINGVDHSPNHPDQISMRIIEKIWDKMHEKT